MSEIPTRPNLREIFLSGERRLEVFFYTSNLPKFLHASTVFKRSGLALRHFKSRTDPYSEDYSAGTERLLTKAIGEIIATVGRQSVFFVEDTSLRLEALSEGADDFPGLAVKEWFSSTSFRKLDGELRRQGNNRTATIKSDIALHIPGLERPLFFRGTISGIVASSPPIFKEDPQHPWLTPTTFNGWFIPDGSNRRLGEMDLEESWKFDFRTKALEILLARLEEYAAILNLPSQSYTRSRHAAASSQLLLFPERPVLVVVGKTCAGKSSFGEHAELRGFEWAEASAVLRTFRSKFENEPTKDSEFAKKTLDAKGQDAVAKKVLQLYANRLGDGLVVTGFRAIEELETVKAQIPHAQVVLVEASERLRYQRHLARGRIASVKSVTEFREHDIEQWKFGLLRVAEDFADVRVINEGTLDDYRQKIEFLISGGTGHFPGVSRKVHPRHGLAENQLFRCLLVLQQAGRSLSCDEIQTLTAKEGGAIRHNNANKVLKRVPELVKRYDPPNERVRYEVSNAGRAYIRCMKAWLERASRDGAVSPVKASQAKR